jgi:DNA repair exonuclease SbcCD ATPase subunit
MTVNRLVLHNYMIHKDFTGDFSGNLIALTGEMGHGKSTFVGALQFCLTGEHPPWRREDLISWGETEGSAKLYFTHNGVECSVMRKLHCSEAVLRMGDETVTGVRNVDKALAERIGVDKEVLRQVGFIQQGDVLTILFDEPAKRERAFQKLLGIGDANKIWTELGAIIQGYSKPENFDASIESIRQSMSRLETELDAVDRTLATSRKALDLLPSGDEVKEKVARLTKVQYAVTMLTGEKASIAAMNDKVSECLARRASLESMKAEALSRLGCDPGDMEKGIEQLRLDHNSALAELNNMKRLSGASDRNGTCPICGSRVAPGQISSHTSAELARLEEAEASSRKVYDDMSSEFAKIKKAITEVDGATAELDSTLASTTAALDAANDRVAHMLGEFAGCGVTPDQADDLGKLKESVDKELAEYNAASSKFNELTRSMAMLEGEKNAKMQQLVQAREALEAKVKEKELQAPVAEKLEKLQSVRNWFHVSNGPRTLSLNAIKGMTGYINDYLRKLGSEIEVQPDNQGLSFAFSYVDGRTVSDPLPSAAKLSGGQRISLALAFIFANYMYFGGKIGVMVLDEPTAHLSPAGVEHFGTLLQTVSTLAKNMNLQIIMPTHEKEILPFMDSEIHFS